MQAELTTPYFKALQVRLDEEIKTKVVYPPTSLMFSAFTLCPLPTLKVVILGQDPYHGVGQAHGLAFSVPDGVKLPPSLRNIYKELKTDLGTTTPSSGNLERWAKQGVLLLNSTLTVTANTPGSHQGLGWEIFTDAVIRTISREQEHVVFILWGKYAEAKAGLIDTDKHLILTAPHPSPFSAYKGFFGSKPFSQTNAYLAAHGVQEILW